MESKRFFIQFPHPGGEFISRKGQTLSDWTRNDDEHTRKFMEFTGSWLNNPDGKIQQGPLHAWGEWEPESRLSQPYEQNQINGREPRNLWEPYWCARRSYRGLHNTDPFIFGERFIYSNCRQLSQTRLKYLKKGSVIAFGSAMRPKNDEPYWVLDTVFVIADSFLYKPSSLNQRLAGKVSFDWLKITGGPLTANLQSECAQSMPKGNCVPTNGQEGPELRLYRGATIKDPVHGMFSFFPAKPAIDDESGFPRPRIDLPREFFTPGNAQSAKGARRNISSDLPYGKLKSLWQCLADQVLSKRLVLGTQATLPTCKRRLLNQKLVL